ncbi:unnamed protein product, partial [Ixodes pacificus]
QSPHSRKRWSAFPRSSRSAVLGARRRRRGQRQHMFRSLLQGRQPDETVADDEKGQPPPAHRLPRVRAGVAVALMPAP